MFRTTICFAAILFTCALARAQFVVGDFECQPAGATIGATPDCEGWTSPGGFSPILATGQAIACSTMPTSGGHFLEVPVNSQIASPTPVIGSPSPIYPFAAGSVNEVCLTTVATTSQIAVDWFFLGTAGGGGTVFTQIAVIDPITNAIIAPIVVADETTMGLINAPGCTSSFGNGISGRLPTVQTATATIPAAYVGTTVKISAVIGNTIGIISIFPVSDLYIDNVRFLPEPDPARILLDPNTTTFTINAGAGAFSLNGTVSGFQTASGAIFDDPVIDPLIGAAVTMSGPFTGSATQLDTAVFGPASLNLVAAPGSDELQIIGVHQPRPLLTRQIFGGPLGALPVRRLMFGDGLNGSAVRTGSGSNALDSVQSRTGTEEILLELEIEPGLPVRASAIAVGYTPPAQETAMNLATDGAGAFQLGIIGLGGASELYNLVDVNPTIPQGTGPVFGLAFTPLVLDILTAPNPFGPFRSTSFANGSWFYTLPTGTLPTGFILDAVTVAVPGPGGTALWASEALRVAF